MKLPIDLPDHLEEPGEKPSLGLRLLIVAGASLALWTVILIVGAFIAGVIE